MVPETDHEAPELAVRGGAQTDNHPQRHRRAGVSVHTALQPQCLYGLQGGDADYLSAPGEHHPEEGETEFSHIPDWYEWERSNVQKEVAEGTYSTGSMPVKVYSLPNAKRFIHLGEGTMVQDRDGFHVHGTDVDGDPFDMDIPVPAIFLPHRI